MTKARELASQLVLAVLWPRLSLVIPLAVAISMLTCYVWAIGSINGHEVAITKSWLNVVAFSLAAYWCFTVLIRWAASIIRSLRQPKKAARTDNVSGQVG